MGGSFGKNPAGKTRRQNRGESTGGLWRLQWGREAISIYLLWTRRRLWAEIVIFVLTALAEVAVFLRALGRYGEQGLETVLKYSGMVYAAGGGFLLFCAWFYFVIWGAGSRCEYTLSRLSLPRFCAFVCRWFSGTAGFLTFWGIQAGLALLCCRLWLYLGPEMLQNPQAVLLAFYRDRYFHALLPLADRWLWLRNLLLCLALGAAVGYPLSRERWGKQIFLYAVILTAFWFPVGLWDAVLIVLSYFFLIFPVLGFSIGLGLWQERDEEGEETL